MSKVKIEGNASGTGTLTIAAPNTNTDRTLTLPDGAGEILVNGTTSNVGIGTSSPQTINGLSYGAGDHLNLKSSSTHARIIAEGASSGALYLIDTGASANQRHYGIVSDGGTLQFNSFSDAGSGTERMRIDSAGRVTMPYQPAFDVSANHTTVNAGGSYYNIGTTIRHQVGSGFNTSNGRFTAPVSGTYFLTATGTAGSSSTSDYIGIGVNGTLIYTWTLYYNQAYISGTVTHIVYLNAGDYAEAWLRYGTTNYGSTFSGYLIG
jgi:hypothetical protein